MLGNGFCPLFWLFFLARRLKMNTSEPKTTRVKLEEAREVRKMPRYVRIDLASLCIYWLATYSFPKIGL